MRDEHIKVLRDMQLLRGHKHSDRDKHAALDAAIAALGGVGDLWRFEEKDACGDGCCGGCMYVRCETALPAPPSKEG